MFPLPVRLLRPSRMGRAPVHEQVGMTQPPAVPYGAMDDRSLQSRFLKTQSDKHKKYVGFAPAPWDAVKPSNPEQKTINKLEQMAYYIAPSVLFTEVAAAFAWVNYGPKFASPIATAFAGGAVTALATAFVLDEYALELSTTSLSSWFMLVTFLKKEEGKDYVSPSEMMAMQVIGGGLSAAFWTWLFPTDRTWLKMMYLIL